MDPSIRRTNPQTVYGAVAHPGSKVPAPEEIFLTPPQIISAITAISPRVAASGAWWSVAGRMGENLLDVHVDPTRVVILTDGQGVVRLTSALAEFSPSAPEEVTETLRRQAEIGGKLYPVQARSKQSKFSVSGSEVAVYGDYQMKVGDWEWGDAFVFDPVYVNVAGVQVPVMPLRLRSEVYITVGWADRAELVADATIRAHHFLSQIGQRSY